MRKAQHRNVKLSCAIKIIRKRLIAQNADYSQLMQNELSILSRVSHPNIVKVYELLHDDNFYFVVSELARYGDLERYCRKREELGLGLMREAEVKAIAK